MTEITIGVPPEIKYLNFVEGSIDLFFNSFVLDHTEELDTLFKSVINEAFVNVVKHSKTKKKEIPIQLSLSSNEFTICVSDYGKGLQINNHYPPYPDAMVQQKYDLITILDGNVVAIIHDPWNAELIFEKIDFEINNKSDILNHLRDKGRGLSIMIKVMDIVKFQYTPHQQNTIILSKKV